MKRKLLPILLISIPLSLTSCSAFSWNDVNSPAKFLKQVGLHSSRSWISIPLDADNNQVSKDYGLEVKKALQDAGGFKKSDKNQTEAYRYLEYGVRYNDGYVGLAPALYCYMTVFDDGFIKIKYETNKDPKLAYYTMDATKAYETTDFVYDKIPRDKQTIADDKSQAYIDGGIDNFILAMEKKSSISASLSEYNANKTTKANYNFTDKGQLLSLIKGAEYTRSNEYASSDANIVLFYNLYNKNNGELSWNYYLYDSFDFVEIYYSYVNRLDEQDRIKISYKIDTDKGKAIYQKALELAKK